MLAIMYHYVRDNNPEYPNFKNLTVDQFKRQIDLLGKYSPNILLERALKLVDPSVLNEARIDEFDREIYKDQQLTSCELQFKRLFNYYVRDEYKTKILDEIALEYLNEIELYDKLYLTKEELKEMERCGSIIGSHTETHPVLSTLSYEQQKEECGVHHAFAVGNKPLRTIANKYELTRVDCNRFN